MRVPLLLISLPRLDQLQQIAFLSCYHRVYVFRFCCTLQTAKGLQESGFSFFKHSEHAFVVVTKVHFSLIVWQTS
eukprot:g9790.t1